MKHLFHLLLTLGCLLAQNTLAAQTLDQSTAQPGGGLTPVSDLSLRAQTFTVGLSGLLTRVDLNIGRLQLGSENLTTEDLHFSVTRPVSATVPVGAPLATFTLHPNEVPSTATWMTFDLSAAPIPVNAGEVFSLFLMSEQSYFSQAYYHWQVNIALPVDYYTRGKGWQQNNNEGVWYVSPPTEDYWFRTYVSPVPEPSVLTLVGLGALAWRTRRRRRNPIRA